MIKDMKGKLTKQRRRPKLLEQEQIMDYDVVYSEAEMNIARNPNISKSSCCWNI